jgi:hypothetical protein
MKAYNIIAWPLIKVAKVVHLKFPKVHPHTTKMTLGVIILMTGSYMSYHPLLIIPHFMWDGIAWAVHGYGALPIVYVARKHFFDLELGE